MSIGISQVNEIIRDESRLSAYDFRGRSVISILDYNIEYLRNELSSHIKENEYEERIYKCKILNYINIIEKLRNDIAIKCPARISLSDLILDYKFHNASNTDEFYALETAEAILDKYGYLERINKPFIMADVAKENPRIFQMLAIEYYKLYNDKIINFTDNDATNVVLFIREFKHMEVDIALRCIGWCNIKQIRGCGKVRYKILADYSRKAADIRANSWRTSK